MPKNTNGVMRTPLPPPEPIAAPDAVSRLTRRTDDSNVDSAPDSTPAINPDSQRQRQKRKRAPDRVPVMTRLQPPIRDALLGYCAQYDLVQAAVIEDALVPYLRAAGWPIDAALREYMARHGEG